MALMAGCADMLALAKAMNVPAAEVATLFEHFNPGPAARMKRIMDTKPGEPSWELAMARKDARFCLQKIQPADYLYFNSLTNLLVTE